jgi:precorrin-2 dehydrogenase/sirohydrochlorin ferrochelatase
MLPIALAPARIRVGLAGSGHLAERRAAALVRAGMQPVMIATPANESALAGLHILYVTGLVTAEAKILATQARAQGVLVNVEDQPELCDFHSVAEIRRGDLLLTVSTNGQAPGLARCIREHLAASFGPEWAERVEDIATQRATWQQENLSAAELTARIAAMAAALGWLTGPDRAG